MITNAQNRYFHVTPKKNMNSILESGLIPQIGKRSAEIGEQVEAVFLFPVFEEMNNALYNWLGEQFDEDEELIIFQIDLPSDFPVYREVDENGDEFYESYCQHTIPTKYISAIYDETYAFISENRS